MELLALSKLAQQQNNRRFIEPECGEFEVCNFSIADSLDISFSFYKQQGVFDLDDKDYKFCQKSIKAIEEYGNGEFLPYNRNILDVEKFFDITIEEDWARYEYILPDQKEKFEGFLNIRGTIDLITDVGDDIIEMVDWKTGQRKNWNTGEEKTYIELKKDFQFLLYLYALKKLYPTKDVIVTVFYTNYGGPQTLDFSDSDIILAKQKLKDRFLEIKECTKPTRIINGSEKWKCRKLCHFGKNSFDGPLEDNYGSGFGKFAEWKNNNFSKSICETIHKDMLKLGIDRVYKKYGKDLKQTQYAGGGRNVDTTA